MTILSRILSWILKRPPPGAVRISSSILHDTGTTRIVGQVWRTPDGRTVRIIRRFVLPT